MTTLEDAFRRSIADLEALDRPFALVGGFAVGVRANPRLTLDVDLVVAVADDREAEEVTRALIARGYAAETTVDQETTGRLATVRLRSPIGGGVVVDLLFASSGIEPEIAAGAERIEVLPGLEVPVASVGHLIATKLLARDDRRRPTDADDLVHLAEIADDDAWSVAAAAVDAIHARGANRERDLHAALQQLRATST